MQHLLLTCTNSSVTRQNSPPEFFPCARLHQGGTSAHCTQLKNLQDQSLMPEHNLVPGMSRQALFCVSALMQQQQSGKITNQEQTERGRRQCDVFSCL